jgi:hypothetical protein
VRLFRCSTRFHRLDGLGFYPDQESIVPASYLPVVTIIHSRDQTCRMSQVWGSDHFGVVADLSAQISSGRPVH